MLGGQKLYYQEFNITVLQYADKQVQTKKGYVVVSFKLVLNSHVLYIIWTF